MALLPCYQGNLYGPMALRVRQNFPPQDWHWSIDGSSQQVPLFKGPNREFLKGALEMLAFCKRALFSNARLRPSKVRVHKVFWTICFQLSFVLLFEMLCQLSRAQQWCVVYFRQPKISETPQSLPIEIWLASLSVFLREMQSKCPETPKFSKSSL